MWRVSDGESGKQWRDVVGILRISADQTDLDDLRRTAAELHLTELLDEALADADLSSA